MRRCTERCIDNFCRSQDESQSDGKIICLKSYIPMSSKTLDIISFMWGHYDT